MTDSRSSSFRLEKRIHQQINSSPFDDLNLLKLGFLTQRISQANTRLQAASQPSSPGKTSSRCGSPSKRRESDLKFGTTPRVTPNFGLPDLLPPDKPLQKRSSSERKLDIKSNSKPRPSPFKKMRMRGQQEPNPQRERKLLNSQDFEQMKNLALTNRDGEHSDMGQQDSIHYQSNFSSQYESLEANHHFLTSNLKCVNKDIVQGLELNHIILKKNIQQHIDTPTQGPQDELIYVVMEVLKSIEKDLRTNRTDLISTTLSQFNQMMSQVLIHLSKKYIAWSFICESIWKIVVYVIDMALQIIEQEKKYIKEIYVDELQKDLAHKVELNQKLLNEIVEMHDSHSKSQRQQNIQITLLQGQVHMIRSEFQDYKNQQEENCNLELASGSMKQVGVALKDLQTTIKGIEDGMIDRDHQLKRSLTQVVQFHKHFRNEDESTKAKVQSEYGLHELMLQEIQDLGQLHFSHPFYPYLIYFDTPREYESLYKELRLNDVDVCLATWFNKLCITWQQQVHSPESTSEYLNILDQHEPLGSMLIVHLVQNLYYYDRQGTHVKGFESNIIKRWLMHILQHLIDGQYLSEQVSDLKLEQRRSRSLAQFYCRMLGCLKHESISFSTFKVVSQLYSFLKRQDDILNDDPEKIMLTENKLKWDLRIVANLLETLLKVVPNNAVALSIIEGSLTVSCLMTKLIAYVETQEEERFNLIFNAAQDHINKQVREDTMKQSKRNVKSEVLVQHPYEKCRLVVILLQQGLDEIDKLQLSNLVLANYEKFLKFNQKRNLTKQLWDQYLQSTFDLVWKVHRRHPQFLRSRTQRVMAQLRCTDEINKMIADTQRAQDMLSQQPKTSTPLPSPEKRNLLYRMAKKVIQK